MYQDNPDWEVLFSLLRAAYKENPVRIDIAGTVESIAQIDAQLLYDCYNTFYNNSNMVLAVAGNVTVEQVMKIADELLEKEERVEIVKSLPQEDDGIVTTYTEKEMHVEVPKFNLGFKEKLFDPKNLRYSIAVSIALDLICSKTTDFYAELLEKELINSSFGTEHFWGRGFNMIIFGGESEKPEEVKSAILERIAFLKENGVENEAFEAIRRKKYGNEVGLAYSALHGTGYKLVPEALKRCGIDKLILIDSQMNPDGNFPTVASPNPENRECFEEAVKKLEELGVNCGAIIATDPDADRIGLAIKNDKNEFIALSGNQIGALLIDHIIKIRKKNGNLPENACAIKSVVSSNLFDAICEKHGVRHISVLTGFKYIGEKIKEWAADGSNTFIFGYEESQGYLSAGYARDKDAVGASVLAAEMVCRHYAEGRTVYEALQSIYREYGIFKESVLNVKITGIDPMGLMGEIMADIRGKTIEAIGGMKVTAVRDYATGIIKYTDGSEASTGLPASNMLYYELEGGSAVIVRPSGTEPKIKAYILVRAESDCDAESKIAACTEDCKVLLNK